MSKEISKSPEMLQKEATIKTLQEKIKKTRSKLKGLKTRLSNVQKEISDIQMKVSSQYFRLMEEMDNLRQEIMGLLRKLMKLNSLMKEEKEQMKMFAEELEEQSFGENFETYKEQKAQMENGEFDFEENERAKMRDLFGEFKVKPSEEEQRSIRKVFIKLSTHFHPDKAKNKVEAELFHSLQQEINEAYQQGDIDKLLEIERLNLETETIDLSTRSFTVDTLQQAINKLEKDLEFLNNQVTRTSEELKQLRKSNLGKMLTEINRADRKGEGMDVAMEEMKQSIEQLTIMKEGLQKAEKEGNLNEFYKSVMPQMVDQDEFGDMEGMEDFLEDLEMFKEMFGGEEEEYEPIENPQFKIGSSVKVKGNVYVDLARTINMKDWQGRVIDAYLDDDNEEVYKVQFDSVCMKEQMTQEFIKAIIQGDEGFSEDEFEPKELEATQPRDTEADTFTTYRTFLHQYKWDHLKKKEGQLMKDILLQYPEKSDQENWQAHFKAKFKFPFKAKSRGYFNLRPHNKIEIIKDYGWDEEAGLLVMIKEGMFVRDHPLIDFYTSDENQITLDLYELWAEENLDVY